jgi:hypothetical protein
VQVVCRKLGGADAVVSVKDADIRHRLRPCATAVHFRWRIFSSRAVTALLLLTNRVGLAQ